MREIKFRLWHKDLKKILTPDEWHHFGANIVMGVLKSEYHEIMQYTGLKDKNGKEIYEGDICRIITNEGLTISAIEWDCLHLQWSARRTDYFRYAPSSCDLEVIGNVWENPELRGNNNG
jgi:hypothetical protein